jgi:proline iminopeptidase
MLSLGNLAVHKRLDNLVEAASFVDQRHVELWTVEPGDGRRPPPPRSAWMRAVRRVDYKARLGQVQALTLLLVGRHDPQTPLVCSQELAAGIPNATLRIFKHSGHSPFIEEPALCQETLAGFLA